MKLLIAILVLMLGCTAANATMKLHGGGAAPGCPFGTTYPDGCPGAPVGGNVQYSNFFTSRALQSGQTYSTRPPWNVAGVDYPVGIPAASFPLQDPATAQTAPTCTTGTPGCIPQGCSYSGVTFVLTCNSGSSPDIVFDGFDFSLHNCVLLNITSSLNASSNVTIKNSNFAAGTNGNCNTDLYNVNGGKSVTITNNVFDGVGASWPVRTHSANSIGGVNSTVLTGTGACGQAICVSYNAFFHCPARCYSNSTSGGTVWQFNYLEGVSYPAATFTATVAPAAPTFTACIGADATCVANGNVMTVTATSGFIAIGGTISGAGVTASTTILSQSSGTTGSTGVYIISRNTFHVASETITDTYGVLTVAASPTPVGTLIATINAPIYAPGIASGSAIMQFGTGVGTDGTYYLNLPSTIGSPTVMVQGLTIHGDPELITFTSGTMPLFQLSYSVSFLDNVNLGATSIVTPNEANNVGQVMTLFQVDHHVLIANNRALDGGPTAGLNLGDGHAIVFTNTTETNNYFDCTGSFGGILNILAGGSGTPTISGNLSLIDNSVVDTVNCMGHH